MTIDLKSLTQSALNTVFSLGGDFVKDGTYLRPPSLATPTGIVAANEISVPVKLVIATAPDEKIIIRASELTAISVPAAGDYIIETATGQRRDVISAALDPSGKFYTFTTRRSRHEDHGDLVAHTSSEDWGDLTAAAEVEDRGALYE